MKMAADIVEQVRRDFDASEVDARLDQLARATSTERVRRCIAFAARGHAWYFDYLCKLASIDFRDVIKAAEYTREDDRLYDFSRPISEARIEHAYGTP
jgi:hypothetical protein